MTVALITLGFLLANAFFVAAEFAVIGVSRPSVTNSANRGDSMAARVLGLLTSPVRQDRFIATAQIGITLASLGLGMYGEHTFAAWLEPGGAEAIDPIDDRRREIAESVIISISSDGSPYPSRASVQIIDNDR